MEERADAELVELARAGDKRAFGQLVERYRWMVERVALGMVGNRDLAQQLSQEAIVQAYLSLDHLRDAARFRNWLYGIALNVCRSYLRSERVHPLSWEAVADSMQGEALPLSGEPPDPEATVEAQELRRSVWAAVDSLSPKNRAATELFYYRQLSLQEIASTLGISVSAVKGRLHKSRRQLRARLGSVYPERILQKQRSTEMIEVTVADILDPELEGGPPNTRIVALLDETSHRLLFIWISPTEGDPMAGRLLDRLSNRGRPLSHDLLVNILETLGARMEQVRIESLKEDIFYATLSLQTGDRVHEVDARPSDAINVALCTDSPIYVAEEVMEQAGITVPEEIWQTRKPGKGLARTVQAWERKRQEREEKRKAAETHPSPTEAEIKARIEERNRYLIESVYGSEPDR